MQIKKIIFNVILVSLLSIPLMASAFSTKTKSWSEDALLHDGRIIKVNREVGYTFQLFSGDSGSPGFMDSWPDKFWLKFRNPDTQETLKWQGEQYFYPVLLDIVGGVPYLVVVGRPDKKTEKIYGCPELPYIYLKYEKGLLGKWIPIPADQAPKTLQYINLSPDYPDNIPSRNDSDFISVNGRLPNDLSHDQVLENIKWRAKGYVQARVPNSYSDWNYTYKESYKLERRSNDCRPLPSGPPPSPEFIAARQAIANAELKATTLNAQIESYTDNPETISQEDYSRIKGIWTGNGYLNNKCNGIVKSIAPIREFRDKGGWYLNGYQLVMSSGKEIPLQESLGQASARAPEVPQIVTCSENVILVAGFKSKNELIIKRFNISGEVVDVLSIILPATENITLGNEWADLWEIRSDGNSISTILANYTYGSTANLGGTVNKKQTYRINLPK